LKTIYSAPTEEAALSALKEFRATWDGKYPMIGRSWHERWTEITPFLAYAAEIRKVIYTLRKVTRNRQAFPTSEAAMKLVYMALQNISRRWTMPVQDWSQALNQLAIKFTGRVPV
jgi:putative transposase